MYLPKSPGQCSTRLATIGSANTALIASTAIHAPLCSRTNRRSDARSVCRCRATRTTRTANSSTGTMNRKQACPWIRNQPVSATIQASRECPAANDADAIRNTQKVGT